MQLRIVGRIQKEELSLHSSPGAELSVLPDCSLPAPLTPTGPDSDAFPS